MKKTFSDISDAFCLSGDPCKNMIACKILRKIMHILTASHSNCVFAGKKHV